MATSRRGGRPSGRHPASSTSSGSNPAGAGKPAGSRRGSAVSGSQRQSAGSRIGPAAAQPADSGAKPARGATPPPAPGQRAPVVNGGAKTGPLPKARTPGDTVSVPRAATAGDTRPPRAATAGQGVPKASNAPTVIPVPRNAPPTGATPRLSEQLRALPREEAELPDIPILAPRDDSKIPRNWSAQPPDKTPGRGTTRHVKTGTAVLTLESEDAVVIETDDERLVQASDNKIKALGSATGIPVSTAKTSGTQVVPQADSPKPRRTTPASLPPAVASPTTTPPVAQVPVADKTAGGSKVARLSAVMKAIQTDPDQPSPARSEPVPGAKKDQSSKVSRVAKAAAEPEPSAPVAVADRKAKSSRISRVSKAVAEAPAPVPVADKKAKSSRISKVSKSVAQEADTPKSAPVPAADKSSKSSRGSRVSRAMEAKPADDHGDQPAAAEAPEEIDELEAAAAAGEPDEPALGSRSSGRGSRASARTSARTSARASSRGSARSSDRATGSRRMSKQVDPVAQKKRMMLFGAGAAVALILIIAFWYITGPMKTAGLIAEIKGPDAGAAKRAVPELADHLEGEAVNVFDKLSQEITQEDRLELLGEGLIKTNKSNPRGTAAVVKTWVLSSHLGLRKAGVYALTKFQAEGCGDGLTAILRKKDEVPALRANAAVALGTNGVAEAGEALGEVALDPEENSQVQSAAAVALDKVKDNVASTAFVALMRKFSTSELRRKIMETYIVDDNRRSDDGALECYKMALADPSKDLRLVAVKKASARFESAKLCPLLLPMLKDPEVPIAVEIARFLGTVSGAGRKAALEAVLGGIQDTGLDPAVRKQLTVSLGYLSGYKDMTALQILMPALESETDADAQANLRGALTQICAIKGGGNDRSKWGNDQWKAWWAKYTAFQAHYTKVKAEFDGLWKKFNEAGGMATEDMSHEVDRITQEINQMSEQEVDPEDRRKFEDIDTDMMMKHMGQMHKGGSVDFYHKP